MMLLSLSIVIAPLTLAGPYVSLLCWLVLRGRASSTFSLTEAYYNVQNYQLNMPTTSSTKIIAQIGGILVLNQLMILSLYSMEQLEG